MMFTSTKRSMLIALSFFTLAACGEETLFDAKNPGRGPGELVGNGEPVSNGIFRGGDDTLPNVRAVTPPTGDLNPNCDAACNAFCNATSLENPVHIGLCRSLWGVGLKPQPIVGNQACRRLFVDMLGVFPSEQDIAATCTGRKWGEIVHDLIGRDEFVLVNRRHAADRFLYNSQVVSVERIYDLDNLVEKAYRGYVPYDLFAAVASAHPVVTRHYNTAEDIAEAVFSTFMGRPPFETERADLARLYALWANGYYDHAALNMRMPDSYIRYRCVDEYGEPNPETSGQCSSVLLGYNELILTPDWRSGYTSYADEVTMWSGMLSSEEWYALQAPGRILATQPAFWEKAVEDVLIQYLGYNLAEKVPEVRDQLVRYLLEYNADIRSVHYAVATSVAYLQSAQGTSATEHRWTSGPLKQVDPEVWLDSMKAFTGVDLTGCDHRLSRPNDFLEARSVSAYTMLKDSAWQLSESGEVRTDYADLARLLGGCPDNEASGRFQVVSILSTSAQLNFVNQICAPVADDEASRAPAAAERLLPGDINTETLTTPTLAKSIYKYQSKLFLGRPPSSEEIEVAQSAGQDCALALCTAEDFARSVCFAMLSSGEMLFY